MNVSETMERDIEAVEAATPIREAAAIMIENGCRALPVCRDGRVEGIVTDRDLIVRVVVGAADPAGPVESVMSRDVVTCALGDRHEDVARELERRQIRRAPVVDGERRLLGIVVLPG
ncbi:CBS domain-containing protein [Arenibaculum sp.]|uniref:CBS domain-containing protein n=1 Tax=Arenibaculum sp. TaxID=2865862 RepID=UPI002E13679E|nr:CBS domain-containing protein [Arenibaculum sp.]